VHLGGGGKLLRRFELVKHAIHVVAFMYLIFF
jgi:hypothetical protein